jgi:hypothetical protein
MIPLMKTEIKRKEKNAQQKGKSKSFVWTYSEMMRIFQ